MKSSVEHYIAYTFGFAIVESTSKRTSVHSSSKVKTIKIIPSTALDDKLVHCLPVHVRSCVYYSVRFLLPTTFQLEDRDCTRLRLYIHCVSKKRPNFETVQLEIIWIDFDAKLQHLKCCKKRLAQQLTETHSMHALCSVCSLRDDNMITSKPT